MNFDAHPPADSSENLNDRPLDVVASCRLRDVAVFEIAARKLRENVRVKQIYVAVPRLDLKRMKDRLGALAVVESEDEILGGLTLEEVRKFNVPNFPKAAGWYFQQFLKLQFCFRYPEDDYYLIWDADTVALRHMHFFSDDGKMLLTKAKEFHSLYFETFEKLFGFDPKPEFSLVAQHMIVQKSDAREMLAEIDARVPGKGIWAEKILRSLGRSGDNLFSEYETYGNFVKCHYPERVQFVDRAWQRTITHHTGRLVPDKKELSELSRQFEYAAFERVFGRFQLLLFRIYARVKNYPKDSKLPGT